MSQPTETLFVADVPQGTLQSDLAAIFASLPGYLSCRLRRDRNSETVGFVEYATVSEAEVARAERQGFVMQSGHRGLSIYFSHSPRGKRFDPQMFPQALQLHALPPVPPPMGYMNAPGSPMYPPPNSPSAFFAAAAAAAATGYPGSQIPPVFYVQQDFIANHNANDPPPSNTLYIQGLPSDATEREVAHIFRPFPGFEAVRLVQCPPRLPPLPHQVCPNPDGTLLILAGFVSFHDPYHAANALHLLQGYPLDLRRPDSALFLAFSRLRSIPPPPLSPASPSPSPSASPSPSPSPSSPHMSADTAATAAAAPHALQLTASSHQRPTHPTGQLSSSAGAPAPSSGASSPSSLQPHLHPHPHPHHYPHHPHHMLLHHHHYQLSHSHSMPLHHPTTHSPTLATRRRASLATSSPSSLESGGHERDSGRYNVSATASKRSLAQASVSSSAIVSTVAAEAEAEAEASTNEHGSASSSSSSSGSALGSASTSVRTLVSSVSLLSSSSPSSSQQKAVDSVVSSSSSSSASASASASSPSSSTSTTADKPRARIGRRCALVLPPIPPFAGHRRSTTTPHRAAHDASSGETAETQTASARRDSSNNTGSNTQQDPAELFAGVPLQLSSQTAAWHQRHQQRHPYHQRLQRSNSMQPSTSSATTTTSLSSSTAALKLSWAAISTSATHTMNSDSETDSASDSDELIEEEEEEEEDDDNVEDEGALPFMCPFCADLMGLSSMISESNSSSSVKREEVSVSELR
mmetsp:Transcript_5105/g.12748  ORF Transcript_5105/g.12748 Transcript_5105/m.12748 type:complete len:750 (-) Transcript_5105:1040-3289(-)